MPLPRQPRQSHGWRSIACFAVLGLTALWTLSRAPRFEARHEAVANAQPHAVDHGGFPDFNVKDSIVQESVVTPTSRFRLLLSTHSRLFWYYPDTQEDVAVHKGQVPFSRFQLHVDVVELSASVLRSARKKVFTEYERTDCELCTHLCRGCTTAPSLESPQEASLQYGWCQGHTTGAPAARRRDCSTSTPTLVS